MGRLLLSLQVMTLLAGCDPTSHCARHRESAQSRNGLDVRCQRCCWEYGQDGHFDAEGVCRCR
ncbi:MAG: hypothetical protein AAGE52_00145 [Myxococcota bacterium]